MGGGRRKERVELRGGHWDEEKKRIRGESIFLISISPSPRPPSRPPPPLPPFEKGERGGGEEEGRARKIKTKGRTIRQIETRLEKRAGGGI